MQSISVADHASWSSLTGTPPGASSNAVGHLFEDFIGKLLERFGAENPARRTSA